MCWSEEKMKLRFLDVLYFMESMLLNKRVIGLENKLYILVDKFV